MLYKSIEIGGKEYKCVLNASSAVMAERKLGKNPLNIVIDMANNTDQMPSLETLLVIFHASLQKYNHGISMDDVYDIYDEFIADGHEMADLIAIMVDIFEVSGFFKKQSEEEPKNAVKGVAKK